jgi:uncharacterized protein YjbJ (UPF0337 family)
MVEIQFAPPPVSSNFLKHVVCVSMRAGLAPYLLQSRCTKERKQMNPSAKDQIEGKFHEVKGKIKEMAGHVVNNPNVEAEGKVEKLGGKVQKKMGQVEKVFEK